MRTILPGLGLMLLAGCTAQPANESAKTPDLAADLVARIKPVTVSGESWTPAGVSLAPGGWRWSETGGAQGDREVSLSPGDLLRPSSVERTGTFWEVRFTCRAPGCVSIEDKAGTKRADSIAWNFADQDEAARAGRVVNRLLEEHGAQPRPF